MRNNQPITDHEVLMGEDMMIVSKTDAKGKIEFVNKDFLDIAGFPKEELVGQPHNIIRHPDMPPEAFEDLWRDLKAGLPWSGYVKNRTKNGDHYWVHANAIPVVENGNITGYISIRNKPDAAIVKVVAPIYQKFKEGKAEGLSISHGRVLDHSRAARRSRWFELLSTKIKCVASALSLMIIVVGGVGIFVASRTTESLRTVYEDRTVAVGQLEDVEQHGYDTLVELYAVAVNKKNAEEVFKTVEENQVAIAKSWNDYMATYLTPEEKKLADSYALKRGELNDKVFAPAQVLLKSAHYDELVTLLVANNKLFDEVAELNGKLIDLQMNVAKEEYELAKSHST